MQEDIDFIMDSLGESMNNTISHLRNELAKIRTGQASPKILEGILVEYYGSPTPLNQVANVNKADSKTLSIQPWEKSVLAAIEKSIFEANLGLTPMNNGEVIIINIPALTEERRRDLVKKAKSEGETAKISLRNGRREAIDEIKKLVKNGLPEDMGKRKEDEIQSITNKYGSQVDDLVKAKETDIMTI